MTRLLQLIMIFGCVRFMLSQVCSYSFRMTGGSTKLSGIYVASAVSASFTERRLASDFDCSLLRNTRCSNQPYVFKTAVCRLIDSDGKAIEYNTLSSSVHTLSEETPTSAQIISTALESKTITSAFADVKTAEDTTLASSPETTSVETSPTPQYAPTTSVVKAVASTLSDVKAAEDTTLASSPETTSVETSPTPQYAPTTSVVKAVASTLSDVKAAENTTLVSSPETTSVTTLPSPQYAPTTSVAQTAAYSLAVVKAIEYTALSSNVANTSEDTSTSAKMLSSASEAKTVASISADFKATEYTTVSSNESTASQDTWSSANFVSITTEAKDGISTLAAKAIEYTILSTSAYTVSSERTSAQILSTTTQATTGTSTSAGLVDPGAASHICSSRLVAPLPASAMNATSQWDSRLGPECAKLYGALTACTGYAGSWSPSSSNNVDYLQIDLLNQKKITSYEIMGRINTQLNFPNQWVTSFFLFYSNTGTTFQPYGIQGVTTIFNGNVDATHSVNGSLPQPILATRYLRIQPNTYNSFKSFRIEIYGCDSNL